MERDKAHEACNREVSAHHATQMQLTLAQHRLREAALRGGIRVGCPNILPSKDTAKTGKINAFEICQLGITWGC